MPFLSCKCDSLATLSLEDKDNPVATINRHDWRFSFPKLEARRPNTDTHTLCARAYDTFCQSTSYKFVESCSQVSSFLSKKHTLFPIYNIYTSSAFECRVQDFRTADLLQSWSWSYGEPHYRTVTCMPRRVLALLPLRSAT